MVQYFSEAYRPGGFSHVPHLAKYKSQIPNTSQIQIQIQITKPSFGHTAKCHTIFQLKMLPEIQWATQNQPKISPYIQWACPFCQIQNPNTNTKNYIGNCCVESVCQCYSCATGAGDTATRLWSLTHTYSTIQYNTIQHNTIQYNTDTDRHRHTTQCELMGTSHSPKHLRANVPRISITCILIIQYYILWHNLMKICSIFFVKLYLAIFSIFTLQNCLFVTILSIYQHFKMAADTKPFELQKKKTFLES